MTDPTASPVRLLTPRDVRDLADRYGVRPSKQFGQNFVTDPNTVRAIVRRAAIGADDHVLEIGPGLGSLTLALLETGARVTAVEIDEKLAAALPATAAAHGVRAGALTVVRADALTLRGPGDLAPGDLLPELPASDRAAPPTVLVANLPYNVAVPILLTVLQHLPSVERGVVMVQKEVADRLVAGPGSRVYGVPSVKASWYGAVRGAGTVSRRVFWPVPNVDSALVAFARHPAPPPGWDAAPREAVFALVDAAFAQRRKTLRAALAGHFGSAPAAEETLRAAGLDPSARGEQLTTADFVALAAVRRSGVTR